VKTFGIIFLAAGTILLLVYALFTNSEKIAFILGGIFLIIGAALIVGSLNRKV